MTMERTPTEARSAREGLGIELEAQNIHAARVGRSALAGAEVCLIVYFEEEPDEETLSHIPAEYDGFPVTRKVTGKINAL